MDSFRQEKAKPAMASVSARDRAKWGQPGQDLGAMGSHRRAGGRGTIWSEQHFRKFPPARGTNSLVFPVSRMANWDGWSPYPCLLPGG